MPFLACLLLLGFDGGISSAIIIGAIIGFSLGAETDVIAYLAARYFGLRNYGVLFGTLAGLLSLGAGLGPLIAGWLFDRSGRYEPLLWDPDAGLCLQCGLVGTLGPYPNFAPVQPEPAQER